MNIFESHIPRMPRPLGLTELSRRYSNTKAEEDYQLLVNTAIKSYVLNNFTFGGNQYSMAQFAELLKVPESVLLRSIQGIGNSISMAADPEQLKSLHSIIASKVLENGFHLQDTINKQIDILRESQGGTYAPFISSTLNEAIRTSLQSNSAIADNFSKLYGGNGKGTTNILNLLLPDQNPDGEFEDAKEVMDVERVLAIISNEDSNKGYDVKANIDTLYDEHIVEVGMGGLEQPEIDALNPDNKKYENPDDLEKNQIFDLSPEELKQRNRKVLPQKITIIPK